MTYSDQVTLESLVVEAAAAARPPERLTVSEAASKYRLLNNPGSYVGPWVNEKTPYLVEPQDLLTSTSHRAIVFVGPAQCGKTDMVMNWIVHTVKCDPADMMIVQTTMQTARDFSMRRIDRLHRHNPEIFKKLIIPGQGDNVFDKQYTNGVLLTLAHPSINEVSGKPIPRIWLTDYDRVPADIDGEGALFDLAQKRTTTFRRFGMTVAESSPGFMFNDPDWTPATPHQAPPTEGIMSLYNRGDKRRWYWHCVRCQNAFIPDFSLLRYPDSGDMVEAAEAAELECPRCQMRYQHGFNTFTPSKDEMNQTAARWLCEGQTWLADRRVVGHGSKTDLASFWLNGVCAAFTSWKDLVLKFLQAEREFAETGSETALKSTVNTDQGVPYVPKTLQAARDSAVLKDRAVAWRERAVPAGVRFLIASIDVQKNRFVVQVHGFGVNGNVWVIDRFDIRKSSRLDPDGERFWVNPATHPEDWREIVREVITRRYPLDDDSGREMEIKLTVCDSGGREGVTSNAYDFVRWLRKRRNQMETQEDGEKYNWENNLAWRFILVKGDHRKNMARVEVTYPDDNRSNRIARASGEIPVIAIHTKALKDQLSNMLTRTDQQGHRVFFPDYFDDSFFKELSVEVQDAKGNWINPKKLRNEAWDLLYYALAASIIKLVGVEQINWQQPPVWAEEWDRNSMVHETRTAVESPSKSAAKPATRKPANFATLARELA